ncbi:MAG: AsmA-like C-terminal region-containing protein [Pseudomonadota bacterium]
MSSAEPISDAPKRRRKGKWRRHGLPSLLFSLLLAAILGAVLYVLMGRPVAAPDWLRDRIEADVAVGIDDATLAFDTLDFVVDEGRYPRVRMTNVRVLSTSGAEIVGFAEMRAGLSMSALLSGRVVVNTIDISGVFANLRRMADGSVLLSGGFDLTAPAEQAANLGALIERIDTLVERPAFAGLRSVDMQALTLRLEDARTGRAWTVDGGRLSAVRSGRTLRLSSDLALLSGGQGVATLQASYESLIGATDAQFGVTLNDMAAGDIAAIATPFAWLDVLRAPISGAMRGGVEADGALAPVSVTFSIGEGVIQPTDATRPVPFSSARSYFNFDPSSGVMTFDELSVVSDWITARIDGQAVLNVAEDGTLDDLVGQFAATTLTANPAELYAEPIVMDAANMDFRLSLAPFTLEIGQALFEDQGQALLARGTLAVEPEGWRYSLDAQMDGLAPDRLFNLWPEAFVPKVRAWVVDNLMGGVMRDIDFVLRDGPNTAPDAYFSFAYDQAEVRYLKTLPPITDAQGTASLLDNRFVVAVDRGQVMAPEGGAIDVSGSSFIIPDVTVRDGAPSVIRLQTQGSVTAALSMLDQPPFEVMKRAGLSPDLADGQLQAAGTLSLPLRQGVQTSDVAYSATGTARAVRSSTLVDGREIAADTLRVTADQTQVAVSGPGTIDGVPFDVVWDQPLGDGPQPSSVRGQIELSAATVDAFNIGLPPGMVTGRGTGDLVVDLPVGGGTPDFTLTTDLRGVGLSAPPLGWRKAAATPGTLRLSGALGPTPRVDTLVLDAPGLSAQGNITLTGAGGLERARFSEVRIGNWLRAPVDLVGRGANQPPAVNVRGGLLDLRQADFGGSDAGGAQGGGPLSLTLDRLQVTDTIALDNMRGDFSMGRGIDGRFTARVNGGAPVEGQILPQNGRSAIRVRASDAGAVFASAGLLKQARGGDLSLTLLPVGAASFDGTLEVRETRVQDAPAIAALLNALSIVGLLEQAGGNGIHFQEVDAAFRLTPSTMALTRASAVGPSMGLSMDGTYDVANGRLDMQGVISPIYILNGIGSIFTRRGEGLIGFNYRLRGPVAAPQVSVNPLSAFTPGMFREIFRAPAPDLPAVEGDAPVGTPEAFVADPDETGETAAQRRLRIRQQERDAR